MKTLIAYCLLFALCSVGTAQTDSDEKSPKRSQAEIEKRFKELVEQDNEPFGLYDDGSISHDYSHMHTYLTPIPILELFSDPDVGDELGMVESQRRELQSHIWKLDKACFESDEAQRDYDLSYDKKRRAVVEILDPVLAKAYESLREVLIDIQLKKLKQVLARLEIGRRGMSWFLNSDYCQILNLTQPQKAKMMATQKEFVLGFRKQVTEKRNEFIRQLVLKVPKGKREYLAKTLEAYKAPLFLVAFHLESDFWQAYTKSISQTKWPQYAGLAESFYFNIDAVGKVKWHDYAKYRGDPDYFLPPTLFHHGRDPMNKVGLSEIQQEEFKKVMSWRFERTELSNSILHSHIAENGQIGTAELRKRIQKSNETTNATAMKKLEKILLQRQKDQFRMDATKAKVIRFGPIAYLLKLANQSDDFSLTLAEKKKIREFAKAQKVSISRFLIDNEKRLNKKLLNLLTPEQKRKFIDIAGSSFEVVRGHLELYEQVSGEPLHLTHYDMISKLIKTVVEIKQNTERIQNRDSP